jgi:hypothetical protein
MARGEYLNPNEVQVVHAVQRCVRRAFLCGEDVVATWSDDEVARRWLKLFPQRRQNDGSADEPSGEEIKMIVGQAERLAEVRAAIAKSLEDSEFTGAKDRIDDLKEHGGEARQPGKPDVRTHAWERL